MSSEQEGFNVVVPGEKQKRKVGASKSGKPVGRAKAEDFWVWALSGRGLWMEREG